MTTQQQIDLVEVRRHAARTGLGSHCQITADSDGLTLTMDTGEIETAAGLPGAIRIIDAYAALV